MSYFNDTKKKNPADYEYMPQDLIDQSTKAIANFENYVEKQKQKIVEILLLHREESIEWFKNASWWRRKFNSGPDEKDIPSVEVTKALPFDRDQFEKLYALSDVFRWHGDVQPLDHIIFGSKGKALRDLLGDIEYWERRIRDVRSVRATAKEGIYPIRVYLNHETATTIRTWLNR